MRERLLRSTGHRRFGRIDGGTGDRGGCCGGRLEQRSERLGQRLLHDHMIAIDRDDAL